jgi:hypothetical protein
VLKIVDTRGVTRSTLAHEIVDFVLAGVAWSSREHAATAFELFSNRLSLATHLAIVIIAALEGAIILALITRPDPT